MTELSGTYLEDTPTMLPTQRRRGSDLDVPRLPDISWRNNDIRAGLTELYAWSERLVCDAIDWYLAEKSRKARWSRVLCALVAAFVVIGGAIPVVALSIGRPAIGNWGFAMLALAAGTIAYDRYFGYSSSWKRYVATAMALRAQLIDFQLSWTREMAVIGARTPAPEEAQRLITIVRAFTRGVNDSIQSETESWLVEFHTRLAELESRLERVPN